MMKLIVSLLGLFTSISNGATGCDMNTKLSNTCGTLTVSGVNNADIDGKYKRIDDCLFQKTDGSDNYISEWAGRYVGTELGDRRCESSSGSYRVVFDASVLDDLIVGEAETFKPTWPSSRTVTISCDSASDDVAEPEPEPKVTPSPVEEEVIGVDSICLSTKFNVKLESGSGITIQVPLLAGEYEEISGGKNGKPAWQLVSECGTSSTLMYVPLSGIEKYMFVRNPNKVMDTYYFSCETDDILADGCPGSLEDYIGLSIGMGCVCGLS